VRSLSTLEAHKHLRAEIANRLGGRTLALPLRPAVVTQY